jgi:hypothetical protein
MTTNDTTPAEVHPAPGVTMRAPRIRNTYSDGVVEEHFADGSIRRTYPDGSTVVYTPEVPDGASPAVAAAVARRDRTRTGVVG